MGKLIYAALCSLDGYVADEQGNFDWARPSDEVHAAVNDIERSAGTQLYGRRMYETLAVWETIESDDPVIRAQLLEVRAQLVQGSEDQGGYVPAASAQLDAGLVTAAVGFGSRTLERLTR